MKGWQGRDSKSVLFSNSLPMRRWKDTETCLEGLGDQFENYKALSNLGEDLAITLFGGRG